MANQDLLIVTVRAIALWEDNMREIKFRAWRHGKMHYDIVESHIEHNELSGMGGDVFDFNDWIKYSDSIMQFTGLLDKNGKEIYEGDVVKSWMMMDVVGVIVYDDKSASFKIERFKQFYETECTLFGLSPKGKYDDGHSSCEYNTRHEVIGNIYENPELVSK